MSLCEQERERLKSRIEELEARLKDQQAEIKRLRPYLYMADDNRISMERDLAKTRADVQVLQRHLESCPRYRNQRMQCVEPFWGVPNLVTTEDKCFLLMPFAKSFDKVRDAIQRAAADSNMICERADIKEGRDILGDIWEGICKAHVVIADLTRGNPNVTYEVGLADVVGKKVFLLCQTTNPSNLPFDFLRQRLIKYRPSKLGLKQLQKQLTAKFQAITAAHQSKEN